MLSSLKGPNKMLSISSFVQFVHSKFIHYFASTREMVLWQLEVSHVCPDFLHKERSTF